MNKAKITNILRKLGLLQPMDWLRFNILKFKNRKINSSFKKNNPDIKLPPDYLMYESFQINYDKYYNGGKKMAEKLSEHFKKHIELKHKNILDWGCGPGRIIRHLPEVINNNCEFYGTDYNRKSIDWCSQNLSGISFNKNQLTAQLPYDDNHMDIIYGISIFTHLSEQMHYDWFNELHRVLKPGGIMLLSMHGDNFKVKLTEHELSQYNKGQIIVRSTTNEGHRTYAAFHPKAFVESLFKDVDILEHIVQKSDHKNWVPQDIWIVRKR